MNPEITLARGYWDDTKECCDQWIAAYKEIAKKHPELKALAQKLIQRAESACSLIVSHAVSFGSMPDDTFYGERVQQENAYYEKTEKSRDALEGDFPCGNELEMRLARHCFSYREMACLQMGLASEIDPDDLSEVPEEKPYADEVFEKKITPDDIPMARKGILYECLGQPDKALQCFQSIQSVNLKDRIDRLMDGMPIANPDQCLELTTLHFHRSFMGGGDVEEYHDYDVAGLPRHGELHGFAWITWNMRFSAAYEPLSRHYIGLLLGYRKENDDLDQEVPTLRCGVHYDLRGSSTIPDMWLKKPIDPHLLVEQDQEGRATFCGTQFKGQRHGLGSEFSYQNGAISELQGLWQYGKLTHVRKDNQLVPV